MLSNEGLTIQEISKKLGRHPHTIREWVKAFINNGVQGLKDTKALGRTPFKRRLVEEEIEAILTKSPREYGFQEEGWTISMLVEYFSKKSLNVSGDTVKRALRRKNWVYKRFSKSVPQKNCPRKRKSKR